MKTIHYSVTAFYFLKEYLQLQWFGKDDEDNALFCHGLLLF